MTMNNSSKMFNDEGEQRKKSLSQGYVEYKGSFYFGGGGCLIEREANT